MDKYQQIVDELVDKSDEEVTPFQVRKLVKIMSEIRGIKYQKMDKNIARMILNRYLETGEFNFNKPHSEKPIDVFCRKKLKKNNLSSNVE